MPGSVWQRRIGLRTLTISREKDEWGEEFCHVVNGVKVFAMGADYIPEDNILSRVNAERTRRLLEDAKLANMNTIRIWGEVDTKFGRDSEVEVDRFEIVK